jgi:hypothetical protein
MPTSFVALAVRTGVSGLSPGTKSSAYAYGRVMNGGVPNERRPVGGLRNERGDQRITVGDKSGGGKLSAGESPAGLWVNCFRLTGVTVHVDDAEAERVALWLLDRVRARRARRDPA